MFSTRRFQVADNSKMQGSVDIIRQSDDYRQIRLIKDNMEVDIVSLGSLPAKGGERRHAYGVTMFDGNSYATVNIISGTDQSTDMDYELPEAQLSEKKFVISEDPLFIDVAAPEQGRLSVMKSKDSIVMKFGDVMCEAVRNSENNFPKFKIGDERVVTYLDGVKLLHWTEKFDFNFKTRSEDKGGGVNLISFISNLVEWRIKDTIEYKDDTCVGDKKGTDFVGLYIATNHEGSKEYAIVRSYKSIEGDWRFELVGEGSTFGELLKVSPKYANKLIMSAFRRVYDDDSNKGYA
jgi:hypothetical protein